MTTKRKLKRKQRPAHQIKQIQPLHKSMRGIPETEYGEIKKSTTFSLTPTAYKVLKELGQELGINASELLERLARKRTELKRLIGSADRQ